MLSKKNTIEKDKPLQHVNNEISDIAQSNNITHRNDNIDTENVNPKSQS